MEALVREKGFVPKTELTMGHDPDDKVKGSWTGWIEDQSGKPMTNRIGGHSPGEALAAALSTLAATLSKASRDTTSKTG